ncbi:MAG: Ig-like domain-containing protein [Gemmatimonas sp.]
MMARYSSINVWRKVPLKYFGYAALFLCSTAFSECDCGGNSSPAEPQSLSLVAAPTAQQIAQGASATYTITVNRTGFTGPVSLGVADTDVPAGVSVTFTPSVVPAGSTTAIATVGVAPNALVSYDANGVLTDQYVPLVATGGEGLRATALMRYTPRFSSQAGITMNISPPIFVLNPGDTGDATITIARQGSYSGRVTLSFAGTMSGVTTSITPTAGVADSYRLRFATTQSAVRGTSANFDISAVAEGLNTITTRVGVSIRLPIFVPSVLHATRMRANESDTVTVLLGRSAGFTAPIALEIDSGRVGLTGTFAPNPAVDDASLLTIRAASDVPQGDYKVRVHGTPPAGSGASEGFTRVTVTVDPIAVQGSYTLSAPNVSVVAGNTATATFGVTRSGGFSPAVNVALLRAGGVAVPTGLSITLDQNPITQTSTAMRVVTTTATPEGTYTFVATGTSPGAPTVTANFNIVVNAPPRATSITVAKLVTGIPQATTSETLTLGGTMSLIPVVLDQNGQPMTSETVTWSTSNATVATISNTGLVTALAAGTTTLTATSNTNVAVRTTVAITVAAAPTSVVARVELEPQNAEITAPATLLYSVALYNAAGARTTGDAGGSIAYSSSNTAVATINATTGIATGVSAGTTTITVKYLQSGVLVKQDASTLTVYASGSVGHYGSTSISTAGNARTLRAGEQMLFQIFVRDVAGNLKTTGVTPAPVVTTSNTSVATITASPAPDGYFYTVNVAANAAVGTTFKIRFDVTGAGGEIVITVVP